MLLATYGRAVPLPRLREELDVGRDGSSARSLALTAQEHGMRVSPYSAESWAVGGLGLPLIAHWEANHYVVVEEVGDTHARVVDPATGRKNITREEFDHSFSGLVLVMEPGEDFLPLRGRRGETLRFLLGWLPRSPGLIGAIFAVSALLTLLGVVPALFIRYLIDRIVPTGGQEVLLVVGAGLIALVSGQALVSFLRSELLLRLRIRIDLRLMTTFLRRLFGLPYRYFQLHGTGDVLTRASSGMVLRETLSSHTLSLVLDSAMAILYVLLLWFVDSRVGAVALGAAVLQLVIVASFSRRVRETNRAEIAALTEAQTQLVGSLAGAETLKSTGAENVALSRWEVLYRKQLLSTLRKDTVTNRLELILEAVRVGAPLALLWTGAWLVLDGGMTLGTLIAANTLAGMALAPIASLARTHHSLQAAAVHVRRLQDVFDEPPERGGKTAPPLKGTIDLQGVSYRYNKDSPRTLTNIDLRVPAGAMVAVVGRSGSGKSTLGRLMLGLYQPDRGRILYDGEDLADLDPRSIRSQCGVVVQDNAVFSGNLLDNIRINSPDASMDDVVRATQVACLREDVERMPLGLFTPLGERGSGVSGGQRQRIGLARALVSKPSILLLDEATSHLDTVTEERLQTNLRALDCTRVVIAHRLSTVRDADLIVVVDDGQIVERGTHEELLAMDGTYSSLLTGELSTSH